jgi:hypothetical protein
MQEPEKQRSNELAFVCYNHNTPPQYFRVKKLFIKLLVFTPGILFLTVSVLLITGIMYYGQLKNSFKEDSFLEVRKLEKKNSLLTEKIQDQTAFINELQQKLSVTDSGIKNVTSVLFTSPAGQKNLSNLNHIFLSDISVTISEGSYISTFNVSNNKSDGTKVSGYIFVVLSTPSIVKIYPKNSLNIKNHQTSFSKGESFWIMRSRPVKAIFNLLTEQEKIEVKISAFIFSRTGDLLLEQQIFPANKE